LFRKAAEKLVEETEYSTNHPAGAKARTQLKGPIGTTEVVP
jgi:hypothetical protein